MDHSTQQDRELPAPDCSRASRGDAVAPIAAPKGIPMAWAGRSPASASPLDARGDIGNPEALRAGGAGGRAPRLGGAAAPSLETKATSRRGAPSRPARFRPVRRSLAAWKAETALAIESMALTEIPSGKTRRSLKKKAQQLRLCGRLKALRCGCCGALDTGSLTVIALCGLRICPACARRRAQCLRRRLIYAWEHGPRPRGMGLYLLTFTLRFDPASESDVSSEGLLRRKKLVLDAFGYVWRKYIKRRAWAAARSVEVGASGMVHVHALYHGHRLDVPTVRMLYMERVGDSPFIDIKYIRDPRKGIVELAKYVTKGASPVKSRALLGQGGEYLDPQLAARVEVAFAGERLIEFYKAWRGIDPDADDDEPVVLEDKPCGSCGALHQWWQVDVSYRELATLGTGVRARVSRYGPDPPRPPRPPEHEPPSPGATA